MSPGDFVGMRTIKSLAPDAGEGFRIQFNNGGTYHQYNIIIPPSVVNYSTPPVLDLRLSGGFSSVPFCNRSPTMQAEAAGELYLHGQALWLPLCNILSGNKLIFHVSHNTASTY